MNDPSISVVIPAYQASATIGRAVDSLLNQTRPPDEIVVVDDSSPDDLATPLARYGSRVTLIRKLNGGAASARNEGIDRSRGELIAFLDADDYWEPVKLERQLAVFRDHPEVVLTSAAHFNETPSGERSGPYHGCTLLDREGGPFDRVLKVSGEEAFEIATRVWTSTVVVRRAALGDLRFVPGLEPAEDRDLWAHLVTSGPVYLVSEPLATAVLEPDSLSRTDVDRNSGNMLRVARRHRDLLGSKGLRRWEERIFRTWAAGHLSQGQPRAAIRPALGRLRLQPFSLQAHYILLKCAALSLTAPRPLDQEPRTDPSRPLHTRVAAHPVPPRA